MFNQEQFGARLRSARALKHLNQDEAGKLVGLSKIAISNYESGKSLPNIAVASRLCDKLDIAPEKILGLDEPK